MQPRPRGPEPELGPGSLGLRCRRGASSASAAGRQGSPARTRRDPRRPPERARSPARWPKLSEPPGPAWLCAHILSRKLHPRRRFSLPPGVLEGRRLTLLLRGSIDLLTLIHVGRHLEGCSECLNFSISSFSCSFLRLSSASLRSSVPGWDIASWILRSNAWCLRSSSAKWLCCVISVPPQMSAVGPTSSPRLTTSTPEGRS